MNGGSSPNRYDVIPASMRQIDFNDQFRSATNVADAKSLVLEYMLQDEFPVGDYYLVDRSDPCRPRIVCDLGKVIKPPVAEVGAGSSMEQPPVDSWSMSNRRNIDNYPLGDISK